MKKIQFVITLSLFFSITIGNAQFLEKLGKKAEEAAKRTVERRVEKESSKKTDKAIDGIFNKKEKKKKDKKNTAIISSKKDGAEAGYGNTQDIVSGSSFFPDGTTMYEEKFVEDAQGDFPANWETTSGGEIILIGKEKALKFYPNSLCMAKTGELPENYALEFDFTTANLDYKELSGSEFRLQFVNENKWNKDLKQRSEFHFSLWEGSALPKKIHVENFGTSSKINNNIDFDMNQKFNKTVHFTCVVNGKRLRVYIDNEKIIDLPSFLQDNVGRYVQFYLKGTKPQMGHTMAISNIKITEEGEDIRSMILKGGFSTTKILFDSGSDTLKKESFIFLDKVGKALESDTSLKVMVIGHTDSDGDSKANLLLSQKRAVSVKTYLITNFNIKSGNLQTNGKGENDPVADNNTFDGKAKNRRVEFKKV